MKVTFLIDDSMITLNSRNIFWCERSFHFSTLFLFATQTIAAIDVSATWLPFVLLISEIVSMMIDEKNMYFSYRLIISHSLIIFL